jgi:UDP-2-acetamido-2-deoxy-ribo-hexuluronate aminotransferase
MKIDFANLQHQYQLYKADIDANIQAVLNKSNFIMGEEVSRLENQLADFSDTKHVITCSNGTDALLLAMMAMDIQPGDEIITTPFTFIATAETIALMKAVPVFVDVDETTFNIDASQIAAAITNKTVAIMPVSLYGQPADMDEINDIAKKHDLKVIIDGAQCFGSTYRGQSTAKFADIYTTSFFPAKPLGCYGDGGAVFTDNDLYADKIRMLRVHGQNERYKHKFIGMTGRLDTIQAAVLLAKLPQHKAEVLARERVAQEYANGLNDVVKVPVIREDRTSAWAQYTIRVGNRSDLQERLTSKSIPTSIHYPKPLHLQECFEYLNLSFGMFPVSETLANEVISLPMNPFLTDDEIEYIVNAIRSNIN